MNFQFENWVGFWAMDGHGAYVWASYIITLLVIVLLVMIPRWQRRQLAQQLKRKQRIEEAHAMKASADTQSVTK